MPVRLRAGGQRHLEAVAGVVGRAAHSGDVPVRAEIAGAPARVGLEAAAGEHDRPGRDGRLAARPARNHAGDAAAGNDQLPRRRLVADRDAAGAGDPGVLLDQAFPSTDRAERQPAPEADRVAHPERLARVQQLPADAQRVQPADGLPGVVSEDVCQLGVAAAVREAVHIRPEVLRGVGRQVDPRRLGVGQLLQQRADAGERAVGGAEGAGGEEGVAACPLGGRLLEHEDAGALLARRVRRAEGGVPAAHHDDIVPLAHRRSPALAPTRAGHCTPAAPAAVTGRRTHGR
jgi:hypothetical protein